MNWTEWAELHLPSGHRKPAAYRIRLLDEANKPFPMSRMLGVDEHGLLSIGKTTSMEGRRKQFVSGMTKCYGHSEGNLLYLLLKFSALKKLVRQPRIEYSFTTCESDAAAKHIEARLLKDYLVRFGELPPLNSAIPNRYEEATWCEIDRIG